MLKLEIWKQKERTFSAIDCWNLKSSKPPRNALRPHIETVQQHSASKPSSTTCMGKKKKKKDRWHLGASPPPASWNAHIQYIKKEGRFLAIRATELS